jgi:hypothetical protein
VNSNAPDRGASATRHATYRIRADGSIDGSWSDRLCGLTVASDGETTTLTGPLRDQSELIGVLNTLHLLRLTVWSVERLEDKGRQGR